MSETMIATSVRDALGKRPDIELAYLFGSFAQGLARPQSDVDVAVAAANPINAPVRIELIDTISTATGRGVDLVDLHRAGPLILTRVLTTGQCLIKRNPALLARLITKMWYLNADFMPLVRMIQDARRRRFLHG